MKIFKILSTLLIFFAFSLYVKAECIEPEHDPSTDLNRSLVCSSTVPKTTRYSYPSTGQVEVFKNDLCTIKCNEDLLLLIDSAKNVRAGMGFNYPLYVSGQRICNATYDYNTFDTNLRKLVSERNAASGDLKQQKINEISNQLSIKEECDKWTTNAKYSINNANISLSVETSEGLLSPISYEFKPLSDYQSIANEETATYESCDLKGDATKDCTIESETVSSWTENARIDGKFTMKNRYIEKYTGKVVEVASNKTCDAKDMFFTSFFELTLPNSNNPTVNGYKLTLTANNIGNNIVLDKDKWNLTVNCWYSLKNVIFPQGTATIKDEYYNKFGSTGFMYRQIDLRNPFPNNRKPGENWQGKTQIINNTIDGLENRVLFEINLSPENIKKIKEYNSYNKYDIFDMNDEEKSNFVENNPNIITRR